MAKSEITQEIHATPEQIVALWERTNVYPADWVGDTDTTPSGPPSVRAAVPFRLAKAVVGGDAAWQDVMASAADACVRPLVSHDAGRTYLDVSPKALRVLVAESRAFAEAGSAERRAFRVRRHGTEDANDRGPMSLHSSFVEVWEEPDEGRQLRPELARAKPSHEVDRPQVAGSAVKASRGGDPGQRGGAAPARVRAPSVATVAERESGVRVVSLYGLQFDPGEAALAEELVTELSSVECVQVSPRHAALLPPGLYFMFHERDESGQTKSDSGWVAELALRPIPARGNRSARWITLDNLILKYRPWVADNGHPQT